MRPLEVILLLAFGSIGLAAAYVGYGMGLTQFNKPGPGLFPFLIGTLLTLLSIPLLLKWNSKPVGSSASAETVQRYWFREALVYVSLALYAASLPYLGFALSSLLLVFFLLRVVAAQSLFYSAAISACLVLPLLILFDLALKVGLPKSRLF